MPISYGGLAGGVERGLRMGILMDEAKYAREDRGRIAEQDRMAKELNALSVKSSQLQIEAFEEDKQNKQIINDGKAVQYFSAQYAKDPEAIKAFFTNNPEAAQRMDGSVRRAMNTYLRENAADARPREIADMPWDPKQGGWQVKVNVTNPDGSVYPAAMTDRGSSDPDDPVTLVTPEMLFKGGVWLEEMGMQGGLDRIRAGDDSPLTDLQKKAETRSERAWERKKLKLKGRQDRLTARVKAGIKGSGEIRQFGGDAESIIDDHFGGKFENGLVSFGDDETSGKALTAKSAAQTLMGRVPQNSLGSIGAANFAQLGIEIAETQPGQAQLDQIETEIKAKTEDGWWSDTFQGQNGETAEGYRTRRIAEASQQARAAALERTLEQIERQFAKPGLPGKPGKGKGAKPKPGLPASAVQAQTAATPAATGLSVPGVSAAQAAAPPGRWRLPPDGEPITDGPLAGQSMLPDGRGGYMAMGQDWTPEKNPASASSAPTAAVEFLRAHPEAAEQFRAKYGYLPAF